jgi:hypothetical protein
MTQFAWFRRVGDQVPPALQAVHLDQVTAPDRSHTPGEPGTGRIERDHSLVVFRIRRGGQEAAVFGDFDLYRADGKVSDELEGGSESVKPA